MDQTIIDMDMRPTLLADENGETRIDMGQGQAGLAMALAIDAVKDKRLRTLATLRESMARTGGQIPKLMAVPPTIGAPLSATGIATGTTWQCSDASGNLHANKYTFVGGAWGAVGAGYPNNAIWKGRTAYLGSAVDPLATPLFGGRVRFSCESPNFEIWYQSTSVGVGDGFRLKVDGEYVASGPIGNVSNGAVRFLPITFGAGGAADRKLRHFELESGSSGGFMGIRTENIYKPSPWPQADGLRVLQHGDSFVWTISDSGAKDSGLAGAMGNLGANLFGQSDFIGSGAGGSGWLAPLVKDRNYFNDRVATDVVARAPDVIIEHGGGNDLAATPTQATEQALVEAWLDAVLSAKPETIIFMTAPLIGGTPAAGHLTIAAAKQAAAALWPKNVAYIDNYTDSWVYGAGRQGAPAGDGNRDWITGTDNAHPTMEGHVSLGARIYRGVSAAIPALIAANSI